MQRFKYTALQSFKVAMAMTYQTSKPMAQNIWINQLSHGITG